MIETLDDLVALFGGNAGTGDIAGVGVSAVSNWRKVGRIPPHLYVLFKRACEERGQTISDVIFEQMTRDSRREAIEAAE